MGEGDGDVSGSFFARLREDETPSESSTFFGLGLLAGDLDLAMIYYLISILSE